jgi:CheY-like chemotaxis protein
MNTLVENIPGKTAGVPTGLPGRPAHRILVVEDNAAVRHLNVQVLALVGYEVYGAEDGVSGWELLKARNVHLLITDHEMPGLSGLELVKRVRSSGMTLPIIMATGTLPAGGVGATAVASSGRHFAQAIFPGPIAANGEPSSVLRLSGP